MYFGGPEMLSAIFAILQRDPGVPSLRLAEGYWYVTDPGPALLFSDETGAMWEQLVKRVGKLPGMNLI